MYLSLVSDTYILHLYNGVVSKVRYLGYRWGKVWEGNQREALAYCTEQTGSHNSQKEKQVSTIAFVALRYFFHSTSFPIIKWSETSYIIKIYF